MGVYQGGSSASRPVTGYGGGGNIPWHRWQDWVNLILGVWLFVAPWIWGTGTAGMSALKMHSEWDSWIVGVIIVVMALWALATPTTMFPEWVNAIAGIWLFIAPWVMGFAAASHQSAVNQWTVGIIVFVLAVWASGQTRQSTGTAVRT